MAQTIAYIRESECIGCVKCIKACSDQAILGARKQMHTIITDLCTGCEDCVSVCPVDCIEMVAKAPSTVLRATPSVNVKRELESNSLLNHDTQSKKDLIAAAVARTLARRAWNKGNADDTTENPRDL